MKKFLIRFIQKRALRKANVVHKRRYISINDASTVAFIFNANDDGVAEAVSFLRNELKARHIKYRAVAVDMKESSEGVPMYQYDPNVINFYLTDFNWYSLPIHRLATEFIAEPFDFLIDLSKNRLFPIDYIIESSHSSLKIGSRQSALPSFDLVIDTFEGDTFNLLTFVKKTIEYLSVIKTN